MDPEALAMAEIARRAKAVRVGAAAPILLAGMALGVAGYLALRERFLAAIGAHSPYLTGVLSMLPALTVAWTLAAAAGRALIRRRAPSWVDEMSRAHGIPRETLAQFARIL
jgi:hypothetical protein